MEHFISALEFTGRLLLRLGPVMFVSLFGTELLMQMGVMKYLKPLGKPVAKIARLPSESALTFLSAIGSMIAAHTLIAQFHQDGKVTDRELVLTGVLNTVPFHFKEVLTFQLPVVLPLLGIRLCVIYVAAFVLAGILKLAFVIIYGRLRQTRYESDRDAFDAPECDPEERDCSPRPFRQLVADAFNARKRLFSRMIFLLGTVTLIVQVLANTGALNALDGLIGPLTSAFGLPPAVIAPLSVYVFSPTVGLTYMSTLLADGLVTEYQAIVALMAGSILMVPLIRLRGTLPRYTAIFGLKFGPLICLLTTGLSMAARGIMLVFVLLFF